MSDQPRRARTRTGRRVLLAIWAVNCVALLTALIQPISTGSVRLLTVASLLLLWVLSILLLRRRRMLACGAGALGIAVDVFLILPCGSVDAAQLRAEYVKQLRKYEGTPYVWGTELVLRKRSAKTLAMVRHRQTAAQSGVLLVWLIMVLTGCNSAARAQTELAHDENYCALELNEGWASAAIVNLPYALVFRDEGMKILNLRDGSISAIATSSGPYWGHGVPAWSKDGTCLFDYESDIIELNTVTGAFRRLTASGTRRGLFVPNGWPNRYVSSGPDRFVHDAVRNRLVFQRERPNEIIALKLDDLSEATLASEARLGERLLAWALRTADQRIYLSLPTQIVSMDAQGARLATIDTAPFAVSALTLSGDGTLLLAERHQRNEGRVNPQGAWILDADSLVPIDQIGEGHSFRWAQRSTAFAYIVGGDEVWTRNPREALSSKLVSLRLVGDAPEWSRGRYYATPAWSGDDRMLAVGLSRWRSGYHDYEFHTLILDRTKKQCHDMAHSWKYFSWAPPQATFEFLRNAAVSPPPSARGAP